MIEVRNVSYAYTTKVGTITVLDQISLSVDAGEIVSLIGPSGCGKTTLLHLIANLRRIQTGTIRLHGAPCDEAIARNRYSMIFQDLTLLDWLTVKQNIELPITINPALAYIPSEEIMANVGLLDYQHLYPHQLSGGMKARVGIARLLMANTPILLMDECFASLDEVTRENMNLFLLSLLQKIERTVIFVTHSIAEAVFVSDRVIVLSQKPATIIGDVAIQISRPRKLHEIENPEYTLYRKNVRELLDQSSVKPAPLGDISSG